MHYSGRILESGCNLKGERRERPLTAKFYGTEKKKMIHSKEELDEILEGFGKRNKVKRYQKERAYPKSAASVLNQHLQQRCQLRYRMMRIAQQL